MTKQTRSPHVESDEAERPQKPAHHHRHKHELLWSIVVGVGLGAILSLVVVRFSFIKISLAGIPVSGSSSQIPLEEQLAEKLDNYRVTIAYPDNTEKSYSLDEMGITVDTTQSARNALAMQRPDNVFRRMRWWGTTEVPLVLRVDSAALETFVQNQGTRVTTPAQDASIGIDQGNVIVTPATPGEGSTITGGAEAVSTAVSKLAGQPLHLEKQTLEPAITEENAQAAAEKIKKILSLPVSFTISNARVTATPADIGGWLDITPSPPNHAIDYSLNSGKILSYLNAIARPYIQPPVTQITMPDTGQVIVPGRNGVDITNKESMAADIAQQLQEDKPVDITLPVQYAAFKSINAVPQDKWIVANITTKRMYAYEQDRLVRTFLISAGAPLTPTVTGQFAIYSKYPVQDMRGANVDGSRYFQPGVRWVMYFFRDYAIHGNYWRPISYFGNVNSSHGCIGIVNADAQWLYEWAPLGTTVIVHK